MSLRSYWLTEMMTVTAWLYEDDELELELIRSEISVSQAEPGWSKEIIRTTDRETETEGAATSSSNQLSYLPLQTFQSVLRAILSGKKSFINMKLTKDT